MTPEQISDRADIQDVLVRYCHAVDERDWETFAGLFTDDAVLDYTAFGGPCGTVDTVGRFLQGVLATMQGSQHTISTSRIDGSADSARVRTAAQVVMISSRPDGSPHAMLVGLWYRDLLTRTPRGWRIAHRVQEYGWVHNAPGS